MENAKKRGWESFILNKQILEDIMRRMNRMFGIKTKLAVIAAVLFTLVLIVIACGGGTGSGVTAGGGVGGTGRTTGTVTAFGSVFVNAIEFDTTSAAILVNDVSATQNDLKIGMKVTIEAANDIASSVTYESEVIGKVNSKGADSFSVLGQTVKVNSQTVYCYENEQTICTFSFAALNVGDFVEVSGYFDSFGNIIATLVTKEDLDPGVYQVKGIVSNLDNTNPKNFKINGLTVYYSVNPPGIADGVLVRVRGTSYDEFQNKLTAASVEVEDTQASPGKSLDLEGIVTKIISRNGSLMEFVVNGQPILTNDQTRFIEDDQNADPALILLNVKVEVKGTVNSSGKLVATEVEIEDTDIED